jgi:hypothetical protein
VISCVFLSHPVHVRTSSSPNLPSSPVTNCRQLSCACARSLGSNCKHIVKRTCFSSRVSGWGNLIKNPHVRSTEP